MKNIEKYKDIVLDNVDACSIDDRLRKMNVSAYCEGYNCDECKERFLKWLLEECKEPVLDEVERKYLSEVIKPFRNRTEAIVKYEYSTMDKDKQFIQIQLKGEEFSEIINLPWFKPNTMYKGMQQGKHYKLEELGL